ncbi:hypothetical protein CFC21_062450 [Triticum aestivum]|uniref:Uncharacterized protein n=2 Tax=Triticum aestivum TaxID=4565 RepID=A0A3B6QPQ4_WHEAT|nr:hypothetical protein CFC21_062450 [Triticum aestivum]
MTVVVASNAENRAIVCGLLGELRGIRQPDRVTGHKVQDEQLIAALTFQEGTTVATVQDRQIVVVNLANSGAREGVGDGNEEGKRWLVAEEAEHGRSPPVELVEAAKEAGVVDEAAPVLADMRSTEKIDRLRRKAHENLHKEVIWENLYMRRRTWRTKVVPEIAIPR